MPQAVVLVEFSPSGGLFQFAVQLGEALAIRGHDVELVTGPDPELDSTHPRLTITAVLPTWHPSAGADDPPLRRRLRRLARGVRYHLAWARVVRRLRRCPPDVVQFSSGRFAVDGLVLAALAKSRRRPVLVTLAHAPVPWNEQRPDGDLFRRSPRLRRALGLGYRSADAVLVLGEQTAVDLRTVWPDVHNVHVIPHGDESVFLQQEPRSAAATEPLILFFGTLQAYKGLDLLLDAFAVVRAHRPAARLLIAGAPSGDVDLAGLRRRASQIGGVEVRAGYVPLGEVAGVLDEARLVVAPYRYANASGVVALAHTFSRPVVATAVGDLPTAVVHEQTGLLVAPDDQGELAAALLRLLDDPDQAGRLGETGRARLLGAASWAAVAEQVELVYERYLRARRRDAVGGQ